MACTHSPGSDYVTSREGGGGGGGGGWGGGGGGGVRVGEGGGGGDLPAVRPPSGTRRT